MQADIDIVWEDMPPCDKEKFINHAAYLLN